VNKLDLSDMLSVELSNAANAFRISESGSSRSTARVFRDDHHIQSVTHLLGILNNSKTPLRTGVC